MRVLVGLTAGVLFSSGCCGPDFFADGPYTGKDAPEQGVRYFLPKDLVTLKVVLQKTKVRSVNSDSLELDLRETTSAKGDISLQTIPDNAAFYLMDIKPGASSEDKLIVDLSGNGLLKGVNLTSDGKEGEIIKNIASVVATVAGVAALAQAKAEREKLFEKTQKATEVKQKIAAAANAQAKEQAELEYSSALAAFIKLPSMLLRTLRQSPEAMRTWNRIVRLADRLVLKLSEYEQLFDRTPGVPKDKLAEHKERLSLLGSEIGSLTGERKTQWELLNAQTEAQRASDEVGTVKSTEEVVLTFELRELPRSTMPVARKARSQVLNALNTAGLTKAAGFLEKTGIVVTLSELPPVSPKARPLPIPKQTAVANIFYRPSYAALLGIFVSPPKDDQDRDPAMILDTNRVVDVLDPEMNALWLSFEAAAFSKRSLGLAFNDRGQLIKLDRSSTSSLAGFTGALAEAAKGARDEYAASLGKVAEIQKKKQEIALSDLAEEIEVAKKKKELIDSRVALEGSSANAALALEKAKIDAQLSVLEAQVKLTKQQSTGDQQVQLAQLANILAILQSQLAIAKANATDGLVVEIEHLKAQIELIKQRQTLGP